MNSLNGIHFSLGGIVAALSAIGLLWFRLRQWNAARDEMTVWRRDKDHADANTQKDMGVLRDKLAALERDWRDLWAAHVKLRAEHDAMKARG